MKRREFFKFIPAAGIAAGVVAAEGVNAKPVEEKKSLPPEKATFSIQQAINPPPPPPRSANAVLTSVSSGVYSPSSGSVLTTNGLGNIEWSTVISGPRSGPQMVDFGVNEDGELWIRNKNGEWKKVVTE
jgi:hypothetical protein